MRLFFLRPGETLPNPKFLSFRAKQMVSSRAFCEVEEPAFNHSCLSILCGRSTCALLFSSIIHNPSHNSTGCAQSFHSRHLHKTRAPVQSEMRVHDEGCR